MAHRDTPNYNSPLGNAFPWRTIPPPLLWINGEQFFPAILQAIESAHTSIWIEIYLIQSGHLLDQFKSAWIAAVQRNVQVCICCDHLGSKNFNKTDQKELLAAGVQLALYNPLNWRHPVRSLFRDHRKMLVIDQRLVFVGGAGISDDFSPENSHRHWRETMLSLTGSIVQDWIVLFNSVWQQFSPPLPATRSHEPPESPPDNTATTQARARINCSDLLHPHGTSLPLLEAMRHTSHYIWIATPYFLPPHRLRKALRQAAKRRVDVRLLIPGTFSDHPWLGLFSRTFYPGLLRAGVQIYEYQPRFLHMKVMLCDDWVSIGSSNLDRWGMFWNLEANQELHHPETAKNVKSMLEADFQVSEQILNVRRSLRLQLLRRLLQAAIRFMERLRR